VIAVITKILQMDFLLGVVFNTTADLLRNGTSRENASFRVHQTHLPSASSPIGSPARGARFCRLGPNQQSKLGFDRFRHFGAQSALQMGGAHVLRGLIDSHGGRGKVDRSLETLIGWNVRAMAAANAHLIQLQLLVSSSNATGHFLVSRGKDFNVHSQKDLKFGQEQLIRRAGQHHGQLAATN
jgi:hypothetical protein